MSAFKTYFKEQFHWRMLFLEHSNPSDFYLSCWQATRSSVPLLMFRLCLFLSAVGIVLYSSILYMISGVFMFWFIYLTHWGLSLIVLTTGFAVAVSARCYLYGPITAGAEFSLPWYVRVYWVLYNIAVPLAFLITVFYWTLLYDAGFEEELNHGLDVAVHGLNSVLMFLLLASSSHPSRLMHFYQPLILGAVYMLFGLIFYLAGGVDQNGNAWIYSVVDWSNPGSTVGVLAVTGLLLVLLQCLTVAIAAGRDALTNALIKPSVIVHIDEGLPLRQPLGGPRD